MTLLDLNIDLAAGPGRRAVPVDFEIVREVTEADVELLAVTPANSKPPAIKRISDRHHALARLLASGMPESEAALTLNYDVSRVSILKDSPAFQELLALYRAKVDTEFATNLDHMAGMSRDALLELRERIEENPEDFSHRELLAIITELNDRAQAGSDNTKHLPTKIELVAHVPDDDSAD